MKTGQKKENKIKTTKNKKTTVKNEKNDNEKDVHRLFFNNPFFWFNAFI